MGKINQLSFAVANLIAAGEVVDRPASVVKELLENSIDAGADKITVEIGRGGVSLIRVCDNGCGISKEDLPLSIKRHATSKIADAQDLDSIMTLGFRGEALAAISAVSDVKIISKERDAEFGYLLTSAAGADVDVCEIGCADGTTVLVENIFSNVPARRKFLKKDVTEAIAVTAVVEKIALSRPDIAFTYLIDGQQRFSTSGDGKIKNTVYAVLGRDFASRLVEVDSKYETLRVYGYVGRSDNCRANRNMQNFFINHRYVKSKTATAAIEQAYSSYIAEGRFPVCVLFIDIPPFSVDVNVHPAKLEVKFSNEKAVFESVYYSVRTALESHTQKSEFTLPGISEKKNYQTFSYPKSAQNTTSSSSSFIPATNAFLPMEDKTEPKGKKTSLLDYDRSFRLKNTDPHTIGFHVYGESEKANLPDTKTENIPLAQQNALQNSEDVFSNLSEDLRSSDRNFSPSSDACEDASSIVIDEGDSNGIEPYRIIGVCFNTYILVQQSEKLLIIDKHAAHERIIFEQLKANLKKISHASQMLLLPIELQLSPEEFTAVLEFKEEIEKTGFDFTSEDSTRHVKIEAIPDMLSISAAQDVFVTMLNNLAQKHESAAITRDAVYERALYQSACKAAVKGGREDNEDNIAWICDMLMTIADIKVCPHGRPVVTELDKRYIDRQFERIK